MNGKHFFFRGLSNSKFKLVPSLLYANEGISFTTPQIINTIFDILLESTYKLKEYGEKYGWETFRYPSFNEKLYYLSIGRHMGLNCQLMDWTSSIDTAIAFTTFDRNQQNEDAVLWILETDSSFKPENIDPFTISDNKIHIVKEDYYSSVNKTIIDFPLGIHRKFRQNGFFTVVSKNKVTYPLNSDEFECDFLFHKIIIKSSFKDLLFIESKKKEKWLYVKSKKSSEIEDFVGRLNKRIYNKIKI